MSWMAFDIVDVALSGVKVLERNPLEDSRGFFCRFFCARELASAGLHKPIAQMNHTLTRKRGAVRGMHFQQPPYAEMKIVSCMKGAIFDVAVDIRAGSPTFLQWHAEILSQNNFKSLLIPEGFAHGFQVLEPETELLYLHTEFYKKSSEGGISYDDPAIGIEWPLPVTEVSEKDREHPPLAKGFTGIKA